MPKRTESRRSARCSHTQAFQYSDIIDNSLRVETTQVSMDARMDIQSVKYAPVEYRSFLKRKGILTHSTAWMKLGQSLKDHYCVIPLL